MAIKIGTKILATTDVGTRIKMQVTAKLSDGTYMAESPASVWIAVIDPGTGQISGAGIISYVEIIDG